MAASAVPFDTDKIRHEFLNSGQRSVDVVLADTTRRVAIYVKLADDGELLLFRGDSPVAVHWPLAAGEHEFDIPAGPRTLRFMLLDPNVSLAEIAIRED